MTVYTPREDSFLLRDYIQELDMKGKRVLDLGTGSGLIGVAAAEKGADVVSLDINPEAIKYAREKAKKKDVGDQIEFVESDLFENLQGKFDYILFNPPYLPGEDGVGDEEIWRGGEEGIEVTERFLKSAPDYLDADGELLVILSSHTDWEDLIDRFNLEIIDSEKLWFETLYLARSK